MTKSPSSSNQKQEGTNPSRTEISLSADSQILANDFEDFDERVEDIRKRSEIALEKMLVMPIPKSSRQKTKSDAKQKVSKKEHQTKEEANFSPSGSPRNVSGSPKKVSAQKKLKKSPKKKSRSKSPQPILTEKPPIVIPDSTERYENKLTLMQNQLLRINQENNRLKALIREYQVKLRDSKIEAEKIRDSLDISQQQRLHLNPIAFDAKKKENT